MTAPTLTGFSPSITLGENTVNTTPQRLDVDVTFSDVDEDFDGGILTLSGLLAEDRVSVRNQGTGPGQIGLSGSDVTYEGVVIGYLSGGVGDTLTINFYSSATSAAIEALIENLTYANVSNTPTTSRTLRLNITDAAGEDLFGALDFAAPVDWLDPASPFYAIDPGSRAAPTFGDLDGDGDLDLVIGVFGNGDVHYFENTGTVSAPAFTQRTGAANPFNAIGGVGGGLNASSPTLVDLDGDGDLDLALGALDGLIRYYENTGTTSAPVFTQRTGGDNPFNGIDVGNYSEVSFGDLDGDGDLDMMAGDFSGTVTVYENSGTSAAAAFGSGGMTLSATDSRATSTFADFDGDGDLDAVVGAMHGQLQYFENTNTYGFVEFIERTGTDNPFNGFDVDYASNPVAVDLDNDGDLDLAVGNGNGAIFYIVNNSPPPPTITVTVNSENDAPTATGLPTDVTVVEDVASNLNLSAVTLADLDASGPITVTLTASAGTMTASSGGGVTVTNSGTGAITLTGTVSAIDTFLNTASAIRYTGALNVNGNNAATLTVTANDGSGSVTLGTVNIDITAANDAPAVSGLPSDVTVTENQASDLDLSAVTLTDVDSSGLITLTLTASAGTLTATPGGGVDVYNSGTGAITLSGTAASIDAFLNTASKVRYTGALNAIGDNAATITVSANDGFGAVTLGVVNVDIVAAPDPMSLTGFAPSLTVAENTVNVTPQLLDADVTFTGEGIDFTGGALTLSGLLAEDRASVRNEGTGAGQIGLSGTDVTYGGTIIGTLAGGVGGTLTITFSAAATGEAIDALIQNLTYANVSDTPTATRTLGLNVTDASGGSLGGATTFTAATGAANPFNGFDVGYQSTPALVDLDGDGDLDLVSGERYGQFRTFRNDDGVFTQLTGGDNPFNGLDAGEYSNATFADVDGDGDLDMVFGDSYGRVRVSTNGTNGTSGPFAGFGISPFPSFYSYSSRPAFTDLDGDGDLDLVVGFNNGPIRAFVFDGGYWVELTGGNNPFAGITTDYRSAPTFVDLDGDGDKDLVLGQTSGNLRTFDNDGGVFTELTGASNPFDGLIINSNSSPAFGDLDGDGDMDLVVGHSYGQFSTYFNTTVVAPSITVTVNAENDAPTATGLPTDVTVVEDVASNLDLSAVTLADLDASGDITVVLTASTGILTATTGGGVTVTNSGTTAITLTGTVSAIDTFLNTASNIQYTGATNASGNNAATVTVTADDGQGSGSVTLGTVNVDITAVNDAMSLTGFGPSATFDENTVNATPQLLDLDVVFTDPDSFTGGALTITGVSADDRYSVRNEGTGAGQIGLNGADVTYGGVVIGTLAGGVGTSLTITFTAAANDVAIDALIQNLTYANLSDTPNGNTSFTLNVTDADGRGLLGAASFQEFGGLNPLSAVSVGGRSHPTFADMDGDGDMDAVIGAGSGAVHYFENTGDGVTAAFTQRTGGANPFNSVGLGYKSAPTLGDLDGDGDLDLVLGDQNGRMSFFENTGTTSAAVFTQRTGAANPLNGFDVGSYSRPVLGDLDGDGDLDVISGRYGGGIRYFENTGTAGTATFVERTGAANPLDAASTGTYSAPGLVDLDGDGDLDVVLTSEDGVVRYFENDAGTFTEQTGADNPFDGRTEGGFSLPAFFDRDGDGDLDAFLGSYGGSVRYLRNNTPIGQIFNIFITAQNDAPTAAGLPTDVTVTEDEASDLDLSATAIADGDSGNNPITVTLTAGAGTMTADSGGGVTVSGSGGGTLILTGTAANIDAFLNTASNIQYTGAANASGNNADTITVTANDGQGSGTVTLGTVNVDITNVADPMSLTGFEPSVTFDENIVNATPQLLDMDVTFSGIDSDFTGGTLTLSGLLAEDRVSVRNEGTAAGEIGLSGTDVTYGGVVIGTLAGGVGGTLTITFNASATGAAVDALIQNLTYANVSHSPTATRDLVLNVTDAAGGDFSTGPSFVQRTGAANPFGDGDMGDRNGPALADLDGDGDMDLLVGTDSGTFRYFENTGSALAASFTERTLASNPFGAIDIGGYSRPTFVDLDGDGDLDVFSGAYFGFVLYLENTGSAAAPSYTLQIHTNPFGGINVGYQSSPTFADIDGDGDMDAVVGEADGTLNYFENTGSASAAAFTQHTGAANPFDGLAAYGGRSNPVLVDVDGDGDIDLLSGNVFGQLDYFENTGTTAAPVFIQRTGAANPFDGVDVGYVSAPAFADMDGDGDLDFVIGDDIGELGYVENTTPAPGQTITVTVTAQNDAPTQTGLPTDVTVTEDVASNLDLSAVTITDSDTAGSITVTLAASAGTMVAGSGGGVTVSGSGSDALVLTGTASAIDTFLNTASNILYTGASNAFGNNAATVTVTADDGTGAVTLGVVNVDITAVNDPMSLTGFAPSATFDENTVNATPQLLDVDVTFSAIDSDFTGGTLTLSGLLAEDRASVRNEGSGAGQIGLSGADVSFGGVVIGTMAGGVGGTLTITFNASATAAAVDALIQNLTYANVSNAPTATRDLRLNVTDAAGADVTPPTTATFAERTGAANPFNGQGGLLVSAPALGDLDGDGDLDAVVGDQYGVLSFFENTGTATAPVFVHRTGATNPFNGVDVGTYSAPSLVDLDGDGDLDAVVGATDGTLRAFRNGTAGASGAFAELTGADNPFNGIDVGNYSTPSFVDLDGDGDLDAVVGNDIGTLRVFRNGTEGASGNFAELTGAANPFDGVDVSGIASGRSAPSFVDLDGDGDMDAVVGKYNGMLQVFRNGTAGTSGAFAELTGPANPFNGVDVSLSFGPTSTPSFGDLDGDGDLDAVVGEYDGVLNYFENTTPRGQTITVTVTAENDAPTGSGLPGDVTVTEDTASDLDLSTVTVGDVDAAGAITVTLTASHGTLSAVSVGGGGATVFGAGTDTLILIGSVAAINAFLSTASSIQFTGASNANGENAATVTVQVDDGLAMHNLGTVNIDITAADDAMDLSGLSTSVTFDENTVNATPQLLDSDVTFTDVDSFDGGSLIVSGLLAEDRVAVRNQGTGAGQIGRSGADITYGGVVIGTLAGGSGGTLTITFNASATAAAIDALIQNLTYANVSDTPTASRDLLLDVTDADGGILSTGTAFITVNVTAQTDAVSGTAAGETLTASGPGDIANGLGGDDILIGGNGAQTLNGGDDNDNLRGRGGNDVLNGGAGSDTADYSTAAAAVSVRLASNVTLNDGDGGVDTLNSVENATGSAFNDTLFGNTGNNVLSGGLGGDILLGLDGNDRLIGGSGASNTLQGGLGDDTYVVEANDTVTEFSGEGTDTVETNRATYTLGSHVENLTNFGSGTFTGTGNGLANVMTGGSGADRLDGGSGDDRLVGRGGADTLIGGLGTDTVDYSTAAAGVSVRMAVNATLNDGDGSTDTLSGIENVTGSAFNDVIFGDANGNVLNGGLGADTLLGLDGNDTLIGGAGASNTLQGGLGDDTYVVSANDTITELSGQGTDTVQTDRAFFTLGSHLENLTYTGTGDFQGTGNSLANVITGGAGADTLTGGLGDDTLIGGGGIDYVVLSGVLADYVVTDLGGGNYRIVDSVGGRDGTDLTNGVERVRFASGPTVTLASLAVSGGVPVGTDGKSDARAEVLPVLSDDDFVMTKGGDMPEVLPGVDDPFRAPDGLGLDLQAASPWTMLTVDQDGLAGHTPDPFVGLWDDSGWNL